MLGNKLCSFVLVSAALPQIPADAIQLFVRKSTFLSPLDTEIPLITCGILSKKNSHYLSIGRTHCAPVISSPLPWHRGCVDFWIHFNELSMRCKNGRDCATDKTAAKRSAIREPATVERMCCSANYIYYYYCRYEDWEVSTDDMPRNITKYHPPSLIMPNAREREHPSKCRKKQFY